MKLNTWQDWLRFVGLTLLIVGYAIALNYNLLFGLGIRILGAILATPFAVSERLWDYVIVNTIFGVIDVHSFMRAVP